MYTFSSVVMGYADVYLSSNGEYVCTATVTDNPLFAFKMTRLTSSQLVTLIDEFYKWKDS